MESEPPDAERGIKWEDFLKAKAEYDEIMNRKPQLPPEVELKLKWKDFNKAIARKIIEDAAKIGIGVRDERRDAQEPSPRELYDASEREDRFKLSSRILSHLSQGEQGFLLEELPSALRMKIYQYKLDPETALRFDLRQPEDTHENDAFFTFLNEGLSMVQSRHGALQGNEN